MEAALQAARQARKGGHLPNAVAALHDLKQAAATWAP